jgi:peptidoglycan/LPS O-acetylase OafA/YrhL
MDARLPVEDLKPLTSLRFFAAFAIVLLHAKLYTAWGWLPTDRIPLGHGVSFFFVLSGFILTHVYSSRQDIGYFGFVRLRVARLWPVHVVTLLLVVLFVRPETFDGVGFFDRRATLLANLTLTQSVFPFTSYFLSWNSVSWSISTEMCFYLLFPFLLPNIKRLWMRNLLISGAVAASVFVLLRLFHVPPGSTDVDKLTVSAATYTNPLVRGFEFCLGMASWALWDRYLRRANISTTAWTVMELAALAGVAVWAVVLWIPATAMPPLSLLSPLWVSPAGSCWLFAIFIPVMARGRGLAGRLLSTTPFVWLGEISFAVYMVHQILFKILNWNLGIDSALVFFSALILASAALHHLVEKPCRALLSGRVRLPAFVRA